MNLYFRVVLRNYYLWLEEILLTNQVFFSVLGQFCHQDLVFTGTCFFSFFSWVRVVNKLTNVISVRFKNFLLFRIWDVLVFKSVDNLLSPEVTHKHSERHFLRILVFRAQILKEIFNLGLRVPVNFDRWDLLLLRLYHRLRVATIQIRLRSVVERPLLIGESRGPHCKVVFVNIAILLLMRRLVILWKFVSLLERTPHGSELALMGEAFIEFLVEVYLIVAHFNIRVFKFMRFIPESVIDLRFLRYLK